MLGVSSPSGAPDFLESVTGLIARYLDGMEPLESAAARLAQLWAQHARTLAAQPPPPLASMPRRTGISIEVHGGSPIAPDNLTMDQAHRLDELLAAAAARLPMNDQGAA